MSWVELPFAKQVFEQLDGRRIQAIMGPRQVGKTSTLLKYLEDHFKPEEYHYEACDAVTETLFFLTEAWQQAIEGKILILDEIQKLDNWSEYLKKLWDQSKVKKH